MGISIFPFTDLYGTLYQVKQRSSEEEADELMTDCQQLNSKQLTEYVIFAGITSTEKNSATLWDQPIRTAWNEEDEGISWLQIVVN